MFKIDSLGNFVEHAMCSSQKIGLGLLVLEHSECSIKKDVWELEVAQLVKCMASMRTCVQIPRTHIKCQAWQSAFVIPVLERQRQESSWDLLASQPVKSVSSSSVQRPCPQKSNM